MMSISSRLPLILCFMVLFPNFSHAQESVCYGTTSSGRLEAGVDLPTQGPNFVRYTTNPLLWGRTYVHSVVRDIIVASYSTLHETHPDKFFKYAETGFKEGGRFKPHKTHQNGLSVDFIVPLKDQSGKTAVLPTNLSNKYGYGVEFDGKGQWKTYRIDFDAMAAHLRVLHQETRAQGYDFWRVIFDPKMQKYLFRTKDGPYLKANIQFSKRRAWVRHDQHYHVDFDIPCK